MVQHICHINICKIYANAQDSIKRSQHIINALEHATKRANASYVCADAHSTITLQKSTSICTNTLHKSRGKYYLVCTVLALTPPLQKKFKSHIHPRLSSTPRIRNSNTFHMHQQPHTTHLSGSLPSTRASFFRLTQPPFFLLPFSKTIALKPPPCTPT